MEFSQLQEVSKEQTVSWVQALAPKVTFTDGNGVFVRMPQRPVHRCKSTTCTRLWAARR